MASVKVSQVTKPVLATLDSFGGTVTFDFYGRGFKLYYASIYHQDIGMVEGSTELRLYLPGAPGTNIGLLRTGTVGMGPDGFTYPYQFIWSPYCLECPPGSFMVLTQDAVGSVTYASIHFDFMS